MLFSTQNREKGFTLTELLIAMALSGIILGTIAGTFIMQRKTYDIQEQITEMTQTARAAMDMINREIRMAGFGAPKSSISSWIDWVSGVTIDSNPKIVQGSGTDPDLIYIVACFDSPLASLKTAASSGDTTLTLQTATEAKKFNTKSKKVICINGIENAVITSISGNTLTIDTDPTSAGNQGLSNDYQIDDSVYLVKVISYSIVSNTLKRNENLGAGRQPLAENIIDLQITKDENTIEITCLKAQTAKPDPNYSANGGYRTYTLTSFITPRNLDL